MPVKDVAVRGVSRASLEAFLDHAGSGSLDPAARYDALARYEELPAGGTVRSGRSWKHDLAKLNLDDLVPFETATSVELDVETLSPGARRSGVTIERFSQARERHLNAFTKAFGRAVDSRDDKFASLALAFQNHGAFIDVPAGVSVDEPLVIGYEARAAALFPYTLVSIGDGARATIVERLASIEAAPLVCGISEIVIGERAHLAYAVDQRAAQKTRLIMTRRAHLGTEARLDFTLAELGGMHAVSRFRAYESGRAAQSSAIVVFFSDGRQHVDIETESVHTAADTQARTIVRSAGIGSGQGRYLGNIKILASGHGTDASLRDDALLLSPGAHIDSIPALEIAANDVKAYHGATVGAISEEELFYAQTRGIAREDAERMIALGFFEPAVDQFPSSLRDEVRRALANKIGSGAVDAAV